MMKGSSSSWAVPFAAGIVTAYSINSFRNMLRNAANTKPASSSTTSEPTTKTTTSSSTPVMDSPSLDQRILRKAEGALLGRTSRLIVVIERCTNDHNYSAILRTVEALGVQHVYIIDPQARQQTLRSEDDDNDDTGDTDNVQDQSLFRPSGQKVQRATAEEKISRAQHHVFAQRALEWITVHEFATTSECIDALRQQGYDIWSTDLSQEAICLTKDALQEEHESPCQQQQLSNKKSNMIPDKLAIVFGTEAVGCTAEILNASDKRVYLPLRGFADSLNLSVSTALIIHQLFLLDPTLIGAMDNEERLSLRKQWYTKLASQRITTKKEKARRRRLQGTIREYEELELRYNNEQQDKNVGGEETKDSAKQQVHPLTPGQIAKVFKLKSLRHELEDMEARIEQKSYQAVKDLIHNPPEPITDMRRADEHRTSYVSTTIKKKYGDLWEGMPATTNYKTATLETGTAAFFRERLSKNE